MKADPEVEEKVERAIIGLGNGTYDSVASAARAERLNKSTLYYRVHGITHPMHEAQRSQRLLSREQDKVLVDWSKYHSMVAQPFSRATLNRKVFALTGHMPGKNWFARWAKGHPELLFRKPAALDPKRASGFNFDVVTDYFGGLGGIIEEHDIPPENRHNEDEKGIQLGGGRKGSGTKFLFDAEEETHYNLKSDNLELVTVIECISADGAAGPGPCFIVPQTKDPGEWYNIEGVSGCVRYLILFHYNPLTIFIRTVARPRRVVGSTTISSTSGSYTYSYLTPLLAIRQKNPSSSLSTTITRTSPSR